MQKDNLTEKHCLPCEKGGKKLSPEEISKLMAGAGGWKLLQKSKLEKNLIFKNFKTAVGFVNELADIAEYEGHHPDISIHDWNKVTLRLSTHSMRGLSQNDFIMAAKINRLIDEST